MTISQSEKFYSLDDKKYNVKNNQNFIDEIDACKKLGHHLFLNLEDYQDLIDYLCFWFEAKYPDRELDYYNGIYDERFNVTPMSKYMDTSQLLFRIPHKQFLFLTSHYRGKCFGTYKDDNDITKSCVFITLNNKENNEKEYVYVDCENGISICTLFEREKFELEDLYSKFRYDKYDISELHDCLLQHCLDLNMRKIVLELVALKLLFNSKTIPEYGYTRAIRFINEMNKNLNANISVEEIDNIYNNYEKLYDDLPPKKSSVLDKIFCKKKGDN